MLPNIANGAASAGSELTIDTPETGRATRGSLCSKIFFILSELADGFRMDTMHYRY